jgi:competence protein ComEC
MPLCFGIITGLYYQPGNEVIIVMLAFSMFCFFISAFYNRRIYNYFFGFSLSVALIISGNILYNIEKSKLSVLDQNESVFLCSLTDYPEEKENTFAITIKLLSKYSGNDTIQLHGSMLLYHRKTDTLKNILPGDIMIIRCSPVEVTNKGNPCEFDYRFYLENRGIKYYSFTENSDILKKATPAKRTLRNNAYILRKKIVEMFGQRGIKDDRLALVAAITLGQKSLLDPETKLNFSKAGAMHIMAVSGLNAGILSIFIFNLLFFMRGKLRNIRAIITIIVIWLFAFITGLTPSVERAAFMFSFIHAGKLINRQVNGINSVLASAFVMMLIQPSVIFDTGFQLSYLAVLFIIGYYEDFHNKLNINSKIMELLWQLIVVTIVAQAGTLALTIMSFNRFPLYFLLTNIFVVPVSSLMIILGFLLIITFPFPFISGIIAKMLDLATLLTAESTRLISSFKYSSIDNIGMSTLQCTILTIFIALVLYYFLKKDSISMYVPLIFLAIFTSLSSIIYIKNKSSNELIVYNTQGTFTIGIRTGRIMQIYRKDFLIPAEVVRHCAVMGFEIRSDTLHNGTGRFRVGSTDIMILNNIQFEDSTITNADVLVLTGKHPDYNLKINFSTLPNNIIITSEADLNYIFPAPSHKFKKDIYYVRKSGAWSIYM